MKKKIAIVGGGSSALMLGCELDTDKFTVNIYEANSALARKFLVAGDGGLNLTHSENQEHFIKRYTPHRFLEKAFEHFSNQDLIKWLNDLGIETFVGSSKRVFPKKGMKPVEVLNTLISKIKANRVTIFTNHKWTGFSGKHSLLFEHKGENFSVDYDLAIFCLGGASWPVTGSTGEWASVFKQKNIQVNPFEASNCAFKIKWDRSFIEKTEGKALKNVSVTCGNKTHAGELILTRFGLEGSGIYPLSPQIRNELRQHTAATIRIDLKPSQTKEIILKKLNGKQSSSFTQHVKTALNLGDVQMGLLKSCVSKENFLNAKTLASHVKDLQLKVVGLGPLEDAISTVGGISLNEIDENFSFNKMPGHYAIGEMLDYDAPTGGYLLQSCFSMAKYLADYLNTK